MKDWNRKAYNLAKKFENNYNKADTDLLLYKNII
jgi:hypothetical protein